MSPAAALAPETIERLARQLVAARHGGIRLKTADAVAVPETDDDAFRVQQAVTAKLGRAIKAWKVGAASPTATPNCAPIYDVHPSAAPIPRAPSTGLELEIAFTLARDFPAALTPPSRDEVTTAIGAAHIVLETCAARLAEGMAAPALLRLADNGINLGLVVGPKIDTWRSINARSLVARVEAGGQIVAEVVGGHTAPDLVGLLTWLVGHCVTTRGGLAAGTLVTTGSWSGIAFVDGPAEVRGTFPGLGTLETTLG